MKTIKIMYFEEEGKLGGPQVQMAQLANALSDRANIELLFPDENNDLLVDLCDNLGVSYRTKKISRLTKEISAFSTYIWRSPIEIFTLSRIARKEKFDLIHAWGGAWQFKAAMIAWLSNIRMVWLLNDCQLPGYIRALFRIFARLSDAFVFASESSRKYYSAYIPAHSRAAVIQSMVDCTAFDPQGRFSGDEELIGSMEGAFVVGTIANINPVKGIDTFIKVAARARRDGRNFRFVVVGPTYKRQRKLLEHLKALAARLGADNVTFVGARSDVRPLLQRFDVYLCTSLSESSPVSVWEAMAMGKPVVSTSVGDVPKFVRDGETGFIASVGDDAGLWQAVKRLIDEPPLRCRMGSAARDCARQAFGREAIADQTWAFYQSVLSAKASTITASFSPSSGGAT